MPQTSVDSVFLCINPLSTSNVMCKPDTRVLGKEETKYLWLLSIWETWRGNNQKKKKKMRKFVPELYIISSDPGISVLGLPKTPQQTFPLNLLYDSLFFFFLKLYRNYSIFTTLKLRVLSPLHRWKRTEALERWSDVLKITQLTSWQVRTWNWV